MGTLREVLGRDDERQNLKHFGLCVLVVTVLVTGVFGSVYFRNLFDGRTLEAKAVQVAPDPEMQ